MVITLYRRNPHMATKATHPAAVIMRRLRASGLLSSVPAGKMTLGPPPRRNDNPRLAAGLAAGSTGSIVLSLLRRRCDKLDFCLPGGASRLPFAPIHSGKQT